MGEKMGEKRDEDKRELVIYKICNLKQNADGVKQPEGRKGPTHEDTQTRITGNDRTVGTDLGPMAKKGGLFGLLVKNLSRNYARPEPPEQRRRGVTCARGLGGVEIPVMKHEFQLHRVDEQWHCNLCDDAFDFQDNFRNHIHQVHKEHFATSQIEEVVSAARRVVARNLSILHISG
ncbi:hypothetical protein DL95DRAFT_416186 [Leptodontidium sp. 2 PMI_412]|nr:hypothetical protein DL95DRAFT_416186 [Leptodontidium sp. 2 PMI_412]